MRTKLIAAAAGAAILSGGAAIEPLRRSAAPAAAPFLDPLLIAGSRCSGEDFARSSRAYFLRAAAAQEADAPAAADVPAGDLSPQTLAVLGYDVSTASPDAQEAFNRGLAYTFGFNHAQAVKAFKDAQAADPDCAICYWGEAFALGPNINAGMPEEAVAPAYAAAQKAVALKDGATEKEALLIDALAARYAAKPSPRPPLDAAFADAMDEAATAYPDDAFILSLAAEANMDAQAWDYWAVGGRTPKGRTARTLELLETALDINPDYPPAIHLYIHITEASSDPYRAAPFADRLAAQTPDLGHLVHMPSHTYYRIGRWKQALDHNVDAVIADSRYLDAHEASPLYEYGYFTHNIHFALVSAQAGGDARTALYMADTLDEKLPIEMASVQPWVQPIKAAPYYAWGQFAPVEDVLALADPGEDAPFLQGAWRYARGEALARSGQIDRVRDEAAKIGELLAETDFSGLETGGVPAASVLQIAQLTLVARAAAADGDYDEALKAIERAVAIQDGFAYTEPPYWYYPARQTLAAIALQAGQAERAEQLFHETLAVSPNNAYAFYGLWQAYDAQGEKRGARYARELYRKAWLGEKRDAPSLDRL